MKLLMRKFLGVYAKIGRHEELHEIIEGRMRGVQQEGDEEFNYYVVWQMMMLAIVWCSSNFRSLWNVDTQKNRKDQLS